MVIVCVVTCNVLHNIPREPSCSLIPTSPDNGSGGIPGPDHDVLILLEADQPPAAAAHRQNRPEAPDADPQDRVADSFADEDLAHPRTCSDDQEDREGHVEIPRPVAEVPTEHGKQPEYLDGKERQGEDVGCAW